LVKLLIHFRKSSDSFWKSIDSFLKK